jgi:hypothetical protein
MSRREWEESWSEDEDREDEERRTKRRKREAKSNSKGAIMSRENRLRKRLYVEGLETEVEGLRRDNKRLRREAEEAAAARRGLEERVASLKALLANSHAISTLLRGINTTLKRRGSDSEPTLATPPLLSDDFFCSSTLGVCLNLSHDRLSLESCPTCNADKFSVDF